MRHMLFAAVLAIVPAGHAVAQSQPLDLQLPPQDTMPAPGSAADTVNDPPGTYYGDVGSKPDAPAPDTVVSGSVSTTIGYSKAYGTGTGESAELNISHHDDDGRNFNVHIDVSQSRGFPIGPNYYGQGYYGSPYRGY